MIAKVGAAASGAVRPDAGGALIIMARVGRAGLPSCFRRCVAVPEGGFSSVGHLHPLRVRRGPSIVVVVPIPPLVRRGLRVTRWRIFPFLLAPERRHVEVTPGAPHRLITAAIDKIGAEHLVAVADECIVAVPLVH